MGTKISAFGVVALSAAWLAPAVGAESGQKPKDKPYPLKVCIVSDEKLGSMGDPHVISYKGREIKLCCSHCEGDFRKDADKYLAKLDKAAKSAASKPATQPAKPSGKRETAEPSKD